MNAIFQVWCGGFGINLRSFGSQSAFIQKNHQMSASEKDYIVLYRTLVEKKLMLGNGDGKVKQRDLEYLADHIEQKSKVRLSISTLKRVWKDDFVQEPHPTTLDALASALDFSDWQSFKKANAGNIVAFPSEPPAAKQKMSVRFYLALGSAIVVAGVIAILGFGLGKKKLKLPATIPFRADKTVTEGVPNTVIFNYDVSNIEADSFFIQQSWNPRDRTRIDPTKNHFSAIYYNPGFHHARLMVNDSVVATARVHIKSDGWFASLRYDPMDTHPLYLDRSRLKRDGLLQTTQEDLKAAGVDVQKNFMYRYYNSRDFENVTSNNFVLETRMRSDSLLSQACPNAEIMIVCEEGICFVPITIKGCVSNLGVGMGEVYKGGNDHDLSALGTDLLKAWQTLRIENHNRNATIFLNDVAVEHIKYEHDFGKIEVLIFTFNTPGAVDFVRLKNETGTVVYADEFDQ